MSESSSTAGKSSSKQWWTALIIVLVVAVSATAVGYWYLNSTRRQQIPARVSFALSDPIAQKLASITDRIEIDAEGTLNKGKFQIKEIPVLLKAPVQFKLALTVPLNQTHKLDMSQITGSLETSEEVSVSGLPVPKRIEISKGMASADINFAHALTVLLLSGIEGTSDPAQSDSTNIFGGLRVKSAKWFITPGSTIDLTTTELKFGNNSSLSLTDLNCDKYFNFAGTGRINVNLDNISFADKQTEFTAKQAVVDALLDVKRMDEIISIESHSDNQPQVRLQGCNATKNSARITARKTIISFLKLSGSSNLNTQNLVGQCSGNISWEGLSMTRQRPTGAMSFATDDPIKFDFDITKEQKDLKLKTQNIDKIKVGKSTFTVKKPKSTLTLFMNEAELGELALFSKEGIDLEIAPTDIALDKVTWEHGNRLVTLATPGGTVKLMKTVSLSASEAGQPGTIPVHFNAGALNITGGKKPFVMNGLSGDATFTLTDHSVGISTSLKADQAIIGKGRFVPAVTIKQLQLGNEQDHLLLKISGLTALLPQQEFIDVINEKFDGPHDFQVNKPLFEGRKWRYRNLVLEKVTISDTQLRDFKFSNTDVTFDGDTDILAAGTVERLGLGIIGAKGWATHPWTATGHIEGEGDLAYEVAPPNTLIDSTVNCRLKAKFPVPNDLKVDWSQVAGDTLGKVEQSLMAGAIHHADHFVPDDGIRVEKSFEIKPFRHVDAKLGAAKVKDVKISTAGDKMKIECNAQLNL